MGTADYQGIGSQYISGCILVVFDMFVCCQNNFCAAEEDEEMVLAYGSGDFYVSACGIWNVSETDR